MEAKLIQSMNIGNIELATVLEILSRASASAAMILVIAALMTEKLIPRGRLDDCIKSRERVIKQRDDLIKRLRVATRKERRTPRELEQ